VGAAIITATAIIATLDHWPDAAPALRAAAGTAWVLFAIVSGTERICGCIDRLRQDIETYGDQRNSDGIIDGMNHADPPRSQPRPHPLRSIR
jgi:hypothetical protein